MPEDPTAIVRGQTLVSDLRDLVGEARTEAHHARGGDDRQTNHSPGPLPQITCVPSRISPQFSSQSGGTMPNPLSSAIAPLPEANHWQVDPQPCTSWRPLHNIPSRPSSPATLSRTGHLGKSQFR